MRVLFDHQAFSIQPRGGISRYVLELATRLAGRSEVQTRIAAGWHRSEMLRATAGSWIFGRYVRHWPKTLPLRLVWNTFLTRREARRWRPNLVHETYFRAGAVYVPGIPTVLTVYDLTYFVLPDVDDRAAATRRLQAAAIARADRVICISETTRRDVLRFMAVDPQRIKVIPLAGRPPPPTGTPPASPPDSDGPYFLHVGLRHSYKNFDTVLQAFARSPALASDFRLIAFGGGAFTVSEKARIRSLGLDPAQVVHRAGGDTLLERHYAHAEALVCASLYEGFGLPALEAMAQRCPVVCSNRGSLPEIAGEAALLFDPTQPAELAEALQSIVRSPTLGPDLRARGCRQAARYSWDRCTEATVALYRELTA